MTTEGITTRRLPKLKGDIKTRCANCGGRLYQTVGLIHCDKCDFLAEELKVFVIPDSNGNPWLEIYIWKHSEHGCKAHIRGTKNVKSSEEWKELLERVIRPLSEMWTREWVRIGFMTAEQARENTEVLLYGAGRDLARERWEQRQLGKETKA